MRVVSHRKLREFYDMNQITKYQYEFALARIEKLLPLVTDRMPVNHPNAIELSLMSEIVIAYEKMYFPVESLETAKLMAV
jgi:HTH-type transcriptional regulator/antitoxin HigA